MDFYYQALAVLSIVSVVSGHGFFRNQLFFPNPNMMPQGSPGFLPMRIPPPMMTGSVHVLPPIYLRPTVHSTGNFFQFMSTPQVQRYRPRGTIGNNVPTQQLVRPVVNSKLVKPVVGIVPPTELKPVIPLTGLRRAAVPDVKPEIEVSSPNKAKETTVNSDSSPEEVKPIDLTPEPLPSIITITSILDDAAKNNSCHKTGCSTGHECVFEKKFICPIYIPSVPCECVPGCRMEYTFIPLGESIKMDDCGNTCSCNNLFGAAECSQRMCNPENVVPEGMFPEITPRPPASVPELKAPMKLASKTEATTLSPQKQMEALESRILKMVTSNDKSVNFDTDVPKSSSASANIDMSIQNV